MVARSHAHITNLSIGLYSLQLIECQSKPPQEVTSLKKPIQNALSIQLTSLVFAKIGSKW